MEQILEKKISGAIFGVKNGTKTHTEAMGFIEKLRKINYFLAEDFNKKLMAVLPVRKAA